MGWTNTVLQAGQQILVLVWRQYRTFFLKQEAPTICPRGEDQSPEGFSLAVLELVVKWEDGDILPTDATFWGKIPEFDIISLDIRGELRPE